MKNKKNVIAIIILIVISLMVFMKYKRDEDPFMVYNIGTLEPNA